MTPRTKLLIVGAIALLFIGGIATAVSCAVSYFQGQRLFRQGYNKMLSGDYDAAIELYSSASRKLLDSPTLALAYGNRAWCYTKKEKDDQAMRDFTESIRLDPRPVYSVLDRGLAYHRKGEFEKAAKDYDSAISKDPNATYALYNRGLIFANQGEWARAIADFTEAIRCEPGNAQFFVERGMAYAAMNELDPAIANFDAALGIYPIHAGAFIQRADAYDRKGDPAKGLNDITEAIRQQPKIPRLLYARAYIYSERGLPEKAIPDCDEALRLSPNYDLAYFARARAFAQMRDWEKCLSDAEAGLKITPKSGWGHYLRGFALTRRGEFDEAISELDQALALVPGDTWTIIERAGNYAYRQEYSRARDELRQIAERFPNKAAPHLALAWFLATCRNDAYRDGKQAIVEAIQGCNLSDWNQWYALDILAAAYAERGEFDEAILYADAALRLPNASAQQRYFVDARRTSYTYGIPVRDLPPSNVGRGPLEEGISAYAKRDYDRAMARLNRILPPNPASSITAGWFHFFDGTHAVHGFIPTAVSDRRDLANAFYYRALTYERKDEWDNAIADFSMALSLEPDSEPCLRDRGFSHYQKRNYATALKDLEEAIRRNPGDALAYCYRAETLDTDHQLEAAFQAANTALHIDPKLGEAYLTRGRIHHARKEYDLALADFEKADALEPNHLSTLHFKARVLFAEGNYKMAAQEFQALAERFPRSAEAQNAWAWFLATCPEAALRNGSSAVIEARNACELSHWENPADLDTLAAAYAENGDFDQAVKYAMRALEKSSATDRDRPQLTQHLESFRRKEAWRSKSPDG